MMLSTADSGASVEQHVLSTLQSLNLSPENISRSGTPTTQMLTSTTQMTGTLTGTIGTLVSGILSFPCQELRQELVQIQQEFDMWLQMKKQKIIDDNAAYKATLRANSEKLDQLKKAYQKFVDQKASIQAELDHERLEWEELESSLYELEDHQSKLLEQKSQIDQKINGFSVKFKREKEIRQQKERHRQLMTLKELPELEFYQKMLALDIQSIRKDMMKFIYSNIDPNDWSKEYSFVIDVSSNSYNLIDCQPELGGLQDLLKELQEKGDFYWFLKKIRQEFINTLKIN